MSCCKSCAHGRKCEGKKNGIYRSAHAARWKPSRLRWAAARAPREAIVMVRTGKKGSPITLAAALRKARRANPNFLFLANGRRFGGCPGVRCRDLNEWPRGGGNLTSEKLARLVGGKAARTRLGYLAAGPRRLQRSLAAQARAWKRIRRGLERENPEASNNWIYQPNGRKRRLPARSRSGRFKKGRR